jgi:hypothetical protein
MSAVLRDAWTTVVPDMKDRHGPLPPLMLALTVVTGLVDAFSYLVLGHVFVANMTGNVVFSGFAIAGAAGFSLAASLAALAAFAAGALLGGRLAHGAGAHRGRVLHLALLLETTLVLAAYVIAQVTDTAHVSTVVQYALIALLGLGDGRAERHRPRPGRARPDHDRADAHHHRSRRGQPPRGRQGQQGRPPAALGRSDVRRRSGRCRRGRARRPALPLLFAALLLVAASVTAFVLTRSDASWTKPL